MEGADRKMMWAQRQRWAAQLLKEAERKGASGLLQLRLFLAGEVGLKERGEEGAQGHWVSLAPEVKTRERHAEEACRVLRQQLPVAVEEYVSEQLEAMRKREGEDDWPAPRRGDVAGSWSWKGAEGIT